jgi:phosphoribosylaminoimidazolecarboxamide formyltransferase/IMP cyclohydrolase
MDTKSIKSILLSVYDKSGIDQLLPLLKQHHIKIYSTGGTFVYIQQLGYEAIEVETVTGFPSIFGGRVKTLHPAVFGGILARRDNERDKDELEKYAIPTIDCVVVDLYPFEKTVANAGTPDEIIEKIDIGGVSLIRAAAKNFTDVLVVPSQQNYATLLAVLQNEANTTLLQRRAMAKEAFAITSNYDKAINEWFCIDQPLRYGENPHQKAIFTGNFNDLFAQLNGKEISFNNMLDIDAGMNLMVEFAEPTIAILKHNNACGIASETTLLNAWHKALAGDPVAAFGGVIFCNEAVEANVASEINKLFFEVIVAPYYSSEALLILKEKKNRIILLQNGVYVPQLKNSRTILNGTLTQEFNNATTVAEILTPTTILAPNQQQIIDLIFANKVVKHLKSNGIALVKNKQLIGSGCGQTSRVDALKNAIEKAQQFNFDLTNAVMASDAFFPFADCVTIAHQAGINAVVHPGGSVKDKDSIDYCNKNNMILVTTGLRHFKH